MLLPTIILGWLGILIFLIIISSFQKMMRNNEYGLLHMLMAFMYALWLPLPLTLYYLLDLDVLLVGTVFSLVYLIMLVITMTLQTGHITYIVKHNAENSITNSHTNYIMATLSNPFEAMANVFKSMWALFLGITFWTIGETLIASFMFLCSLFIFYYLCLAINSSLIKRMALFSKVKSNTVLTNLETLLFFGALMIYITFNN